LLAPPTGLLGRNGFVVRLHFRLILAKTGRFVTPEEVSRRLHLPRIPTAYRELGFVVILGLAGGLAAVAMQIGIESTFHFLVAEPAHHLDFLHFAWRSFAIISIATLVAGILMSALCPEAAGSGIPQAKRSFWTDFGYIPLKVGVVKFVACLLSVGSGCSLGREGPSVQVAAVAASNTALALGRPKQKLRPALAAGAAAGLAAAFNTPLAGVAFVLEELIGDLNTRLLGRVLLASVVGALVVHSIIGAQPAFELGLVQPSGWEAYLIAPFVAAVAALVGVWFQWMALGLRKRNQSWKRIPAWLRPVFGGWTVWVLGISVFYYTGSIGVFGLGYRELSEGLQHGIGWKIAAILLIAKVIATAACYGFGNSGGIFAPSLFFGAMVGFVGHAVGTAIWPTVRLDPTLLAVVGMSACLGAVVRAPVTSVLIVFEMTQQFALVPVLMLCALISQGITRALLPCSFYDEVLRQDGCDIEMVAPPRDLRAWHERPVSSVARFNVVTLKSLEPEAIEELLENASYQRFPVQLDGKLVGLLTRMEAQMALKEERTPVLEAVFTCNSETSIRDVEHKIVESPSGMLVVTSEDGRLLGVVTLHDLLRAEIAFAEASKA